MSIILLRGSLVFENYSQTQIKLTVGDNGFESVYYFDKKLTRVQIPNDASIGEQIVSISGPIPAFINNFNFYYNEVLSPVTSSVIELTNILNGWFYTDGPEISINGGTNLTPLATLNLIEGSNITITAVEDILNNKVDITIDASGGGGGLPPDGTYGDVVVSGSGTVWTVTDDTSNQQVAVYEDGFIRGTRPTINFYDDGGPVSVTVADDSVNNRVNIGISSSINQSITHAVAAGTDTYTTTITGVTSYADGDVYLINFTNGNTTGSTLNINGIGAVTMYRNNDGPIIGGDIQAGSEMLVVYNATSTIWQCIGTSPNTLISYVTNADSVTLTKGMPVYAFGGQGDRLTVKRAYNTGDSTSAQTIGLVLSASIASNQKGFIMMQGLLDGLSILPTSTWADGDPVYLGATAGSITKVKPHAPNHLVYLGFVTTASNGSAGRMYVRVQNGYELDELHDVQAQSPANRDTLYFDSADSQWKTASLASILTYTPVSTALLINTTAPLTGGGNLTADRTLAINQATTSVNGYLSSTDWNTFNGKQTSSWAYRKTGRWYTPSNNALATASITNFQNTIRYTAVIIDRDITVTQLGINVVTIAGAGTTCRIGIYSNDPTTTQPLTRLVDSGTLALDSTGPKTVTGLSVALTKGLYWFCYVSNATTGTVTAIANLNIPDVIGTVALNLGVVTNYSQTYGYAALPASAGTLTGSIVANSVCTFYGY